MVELEELKVYVRRLRGRCKKMFGDDFCAANEELIEVTAKNKRMLDRFDAELEDEDLTVITFGSQGQQKQDINPKVKHRNDVAKLYADNLDALQLTPRSKYKKAESSPDKGADDPLKEYLSNLNK